LIGSLSYLLLRKGEQAIGGEGLAIRAGGGVMGAVSRGGDINYCKLRAERVMLYELLVLIMLLALLTSPRE